LFYKKIDNPIYSSSATLTNVTYAGQTFATATVVQPVNADEAIIKGIEFNLQYTFDFLPGPLAGFGVSSNYTIVGGHGSGLAGRSGEFPLFFQSKSIGSVQLTYEKYGVSGRIAYSFRSKYLDAIGTNAATDQYTDRNGQLDARLGVTLKNTVEIYVEGSNLNNAPWRRFIGSPNFLVERERYGRLIKAGVQVKF
jgi:TonB-dependent receptor